MIRILIIDDQPGVLAALHESFELEADIEIVGEATGGKAGLALARQLHPDIALVDIKMPDMDGIATTLALLESSPESKVIILSIYDNVSSRAEALKAGAAAFVAKQDPPDFLLATVRRLAGDG